MKIPEDREAEQSVHSPGARCVSLFAPQAWLQVSIPSPQLPCGCRDKDRGTGEPLCSSSTAPVPSPPQGQVTLSVPCSGEG